MKTILIVLIFSTSLFPTDLKFSEVAWKKIEPLYQKISKHPFNQGLLDGSLSKERFAFYSYQDSLYLSEYAKVLGVLATRLEDSKSSKRVLQFALDCLKEEKEVKEKHALVKKTGMNPANFAYTQFLLATSAYKSTEELAAALLPCYWIYLRLAQDFKSQMKKENPYFHWVEMYASEKYQSDVKDLIEIVDSLALNASSGKKEKMTESFVRATQLEWYFWEESYLLTGWKL